MIKINPILGEHARVVAITGTYWLVVFLALRLFHANPMSFISISISDFSPELASFWIKGHMLGDFCMCLLMHIVVKTFNVLDKPIVAVIMIFSFFVAAAIISNDIIKDNALIHIANYLNIADSDSLIKWHDPLLNTWFGFNFFGGWVGIYILNDYLFKYKKSVTEEADLVSQLKDENFRSKIARINPDFILSELAITKLAIKNSQKRKARTRICQLADVIRHSLISEKISLIMLKKELDVVSDYLSLTNNSNLLTVPKGIFEHSNANKYLIPPMVIKEFLDIAYKNNHMDDILISISQHNEIKVVLTASNLNKAAMLAYKAYEDFLVERLMLHENIRIKNNNSSAAMQLILNISIDKEEKVDNHAGRKYPSNISRSYG